MMIIKKGLGLIIIITLIGIAFVKWAQVSGPFAQQMKRLALAQAHADKYQAVIKANKKFEFVGLGAYTGDDGCFFVHGVVGSTNDLNELKAIIERTNPPVPTKWLVIVQEME